MSELPNGFTGFIRHNQHAASGSDGYSETPELSEFDPEALRDIDDLDRRWAWAEIDLGAIRHNINQARSCLARHTRLMAVVKANAYGHGAIEVARTALNSGASYLGVATVDEGIELREAGIEAPILILSEPPLRAIPLLLHYGIEPSIYSLEFAMAYGELADRHGMKAPYHFAINTGMNRIGVRHDEVLDFFHAVSFHRALELKGTFTHFATADEPESYDFQVQRRRFISALTGMHEAGIDPGIVHCDNSAALISYPSTHFDMVRWGIGMYGYSPSPDMQHRLDLRPAMSIHARITAVKQVPMSEGVSYGMHYRSPGSVKICTIPLGYADGLSRILSSQIHVLTKDGPCMQVGNICMDQCMFEVDLRSIPHGRRPDPQVGDEVVLVGSYCGHTISMDDLADKAHTISYEMLCAFGLRLPHIYR